MVVDVNFLRGSNSKVKFFGGGITERGFDCFIRAGLTEFMELTKV